MTRSPGSIIAKSAIALPTWRMQAFRELGDLDRRLAARMGRGRGGDGRGLAERRRTRFLQCGVHAGLNDRDSVSSALAALIGAAIDAAPAAGSRSAASWRWPCTRPASATTPAAGPIVGRMPEGGSDFVTAPELSPLFGRALARRWPQALDALRQRRGVGIRRRLRRARRRAARGARRPRLRRYSIVELSAPLRERQRAATRASRRRRPLAGRAAGVDERRRVGNEVLDAMPVDLLHFDGRPGSSAASPGARGAGVRLGRPADGAAARRSRRPSPPAARPRLMRRREAFVATLADRLERGAVFLLDYGFPEAEYYHPQRYQGTLMCHRGHRPTPIRSSTSALKDITAHLDFTGIAPSPARTPGSTSSATRRRRAFSSTAASPTLLAAGRRSASAREARRLVHEHEMGELFKVIAFAKGRRLRADRLRRRRPAPPALGSQVGHQRPLALVVFLALTSSRDGPGREARPRPPAATASACSAAVVLPFGSSVR